MDPWIALEAYLDGLLRRVDGDAYVLLDWNGVPLLPWFENVHFLEEFRRANEVLEATFGLDFLRRRAARQHLHEEPRFSFVAQPLLSAYLLILVFTDKFRRGGPPDLARVSWEIDKSLVTLRELVRNLPPDSGGGGPGAAVQKLTRP